MKFNPNLLELIPKEHLAVDFGGDFNYDFDQSSYWEQVCRWATFGLASALSLIQFL